MRVFNYVPSRFGGSRNLPLTQLIEDPVPRHSFQAQFIQLCDYMAYSLLRQEQPSPKYPGLEGVFSLLRPIIVPEAAKGEPDGVKRYPK